MENYIAIKTINYKFGVTKMYELLICMNCSDFKA